MARANAAKALAYLVNSHNASAAAAADDADAAVAATRTASCLGLCLLASERNEDKNEEAAAADLSEIEWG